MTTNPPDDPSPPEANPYEPPQARLAAGAGPSAGRSIARGLGALVGVVAVVLACLVAFVVTCVPVGLATREVPLGIVAGLVAAALVGVGLTHLFLFVGRKFR